MNPSSAVDKRSANVLDNLLWFEPFYLVLLALPLLLPNKIVPLVLHPCVLLLLFPFWLLRLLLFFCTSNVSLYSEPENFRTVVAVPPLREQQSTIAATPQRTAVLAKRNSSILHYLIPSPLRWPILLIMVWLPVTLWASADRPLSYISIGYLLLGVTLYVALINWSAMQRQPRRLAQLLALIGIGLAIGTPFFTTWKVEFRLFRFPIYDMFRSVSLEALFGITETIHANVLAGTLVLTLPILSILAIDKLQNYATLYFDRDKFMAIFWPLGCGLIMSAIFLSQSRGAYLAVILSMFVLCSFRWHRLFWVLILAAVGAIAILFYYDAPLAALELLSRDSALGGSEFRLDVWSNSLYAISDFSLTGIGIGMFNQIVPEFYPFAHVNGAYAHHAHNLYLQVGLDMGLPGLIAYLLLIATLFWMLAAVLRSAASADIQLLAIGACASFIAFLAHGFLDAVTWGTKLAFVPWILFALITLLHSDLQYSNLQQAIE